MDWHVVEYYARRGNPAALSAYWAAEDGFPVYTGLEFWRWLAYCEAPETIH